MSTYKDPLTFSKEYRIAQTSTLHLEHQAKAFEKSLRVFEILLYSIYMKCLRIDLERIWRLNHHEEHTRRSNLNQGVE